MIHQELGFFAGTSAIIFLVGGCIMIFGITAVRETKGLAWGIITTIVGFAVIIAIIFSTTTIPVGSIGVDARGDWYEKGEHISLEKISIVPLSGSIPLWKENMELQYNLTPEEIISLNEGSHFQNRLRDAYVYSIDEGWNVTISKTPLVPSEGIDPSHLKLVISLNPSFIY